MSRISDPFRRQNFGSPSNETDTEGAFGAAGSSDSAQTASGSSKAAAKTWSFLSVFMVVIGDGRNATGSPVEIKRAPRVFYPIVLTA